MVQSTIQEFNLSMYVLLYIWTFNISWNGLCLVVWNFRQVCIFLTGARCSEDMIWMMGWGAGAVWIWWAELVMIRNALSIWSSVPRAANWWHMSRTNSLLQHRVRSQIYNTKRIQSRVTHQLLVHIIRVPDNRFISQCKESMILKDKLTIFQKKMISKN